jgi:4-aminobutyrate aminotransferase
VAVLETLKKENLLQKAEERGLFLKEWFKEKASQYPFIGDVRGKGLLMGVEIVSDKASKTPDKATALKISWAAWERGLILITFGKNGNVLRVAPPINISDQLLEEALEIIDASFKDTAEGKVPDAILPCLKGW